jgi:hypothetical protein
VPVNRAFVLFCLVLVAASLVFSGAARAEQDPQQDYCLQNSIACVENCDRYSVILWGNVWPTPRTALCLTECTVAYVGCLMMRFREGV